VISNQFSVRRLHPEPHIHHEAHEEHEGFIILQSFGLFCLYGCPLLSTVQLRRAVPCLDIKIHFVAFVSFVVNHHLVHRLAVICRPVKTLVLPCVSDMILW